jgi:D-glycero-D-manno-heptose 1,7-bisphosphate phosphatase
MVQGILLDRDGVINRERADYVKGWDEFEFLPGVLAALAQLATLNVPIVVITNQSAVGRGIVSPQTIHDLHQRACQIIEANGGRINDFLICPHHPDLGCSCRKPKPGLLFQAAAKYQLELAKCVFVGDAVTDYQAAEAAGCPAILVKSGRQGAQLSDLLNANLLLATVMDLAAATELIMARSSDKYD